MKEEKGTNHEQKNKNKTRKRENWIPHLDRTHYKRKQHEHQRKMKMKMKTHKENTS